jgi:hypothetical protein
VFVDKGLSSFNMKENDYYQTPPSVWKPILVLTGQDTFDLDPCAPINPDPSVNVPAMAKLTEQDNGLIQSWGFGNHIFLNPPYSELEDWTAKALHEAQQNYIWAVYPLRNNQFYQDVINQTALFRIALRSRVAFLDPVTKKPQSGNREGTYIIHWGPDDFYLKKLFAVGLQVNLPGELLHKPYQLKIL